MALREVEVDGRRWTVWAVRPQGQTGNPVREELQGGWLAMHLDSQKRRIVPVPEDWEGWSDEQLADAVRSAKPVPVR